MSRENDTAKLEVMCDGHYRVAALLGWRSGVRPVFVELGEVDVSLVPGSGPQQLVATVDPEKVQQGLTEFAQKQAARIQNGK